MSFHLHISLAKHLPELNISILQTKHENVETVHRKEHKGVPFYEWDNCAICNRERKGLKVVRL